MGKKIETLTIYFDGVCNLCHATVLFILKHDKHQRFRFASLQSDHASQHLFRLDSFKKIKNKDSVILEAGETVYSESTGALLILKKMGFPWSLLYPLVLIPSFVRDAVYRWIARNRYGWFGKMDHCMVPSEEIKSRFYN